MRATGTAGLAVLVFVVPLLAAGLAAPAAAASFDCAKAATPVEHAICADRTLSSLDERTVAAYDAAAQALGVSGDADARDPVAAALLQTHTEWSAARNRCGAATSCLLAQYLRRNAVLTEHPDPQAKSAADGLIGEYGTAVLPERDLVILRGPADTLLVGITLAAADWSCHFNGIARAEGGGRLRVVHKDFDGSLGGDQTLLLVPTRFGLAVQFVPAGNDISGKFCGPGGALDQPFPRRGP